VEGAVPNTDEGQRKPRNGSRGLDTCTTITSGYDFRKRQVFFLNPRPKSPSKRTLPTPSMNLHRQ
jgi:hypothetical protein